MSTNKPKIIVKKRRGGGGGDGHHGGAWKVAYADFVTAMMAFFLMMWLINATTVQQKKGLADYFDSRIPIARVEGGGTGAFGGETVTARDGQGESASGSATLQEGRSTSLGDGSGDPVGSAEAEAERQALEQIEGALDTLAGNGPLADEVLSHVRTKFTDEGLVVDIFDTSDAPLFEAGSAEPTPMLRALVAMVTGLTALVTNDIQITGHTDSTPMASGGADGNWALSGERAESARRLMVGAGLDPTRITEIAGRADTQPMLEDPADPRNRRVSITLMRSFPGR
jgi:chemotaxis protein MotB